MGCWGFGIIESDDAMDLECELLEIAGLESATAPGSRSALEKHLGALLERAKAEPAPVDDDGVAYTYDYATAHQVLTLLLMGAGCTFTEEIQKELLAGIESCHEFKLITMLLKQSNGILTENLLQNFHIENGFKGYAGTIERMYGRHAAITGLMEAIKEYSIQGGTAVSVPSRGLLETMFQKSGD